MRTRLLVLLAAVAALMASASAAPASAKGPSEGTIEGEGLDAPIAIGWGEGTPGGDRLIDDVGFFPALFDTTPDPMFAEAPTSDLGPQLTLTWTVPGPDGEVWQIVQLLYPYADGGPLVHTEAGQPLSMSEHTRGGWFRSSERLVTTLQELGVPVEAALVAPSGGSSVRWAPVGIGLVTMVVLGAGLALLSRRRSDKAGVEPDPREVAPAAG